MITLIAAVPCHGSIWRLSVGKGIEDRLMQRRWHRLLGAELSNYPAGKPPP
jgi:hypothetical protein